MFRRRKPTSEVIPEVGVPVTYPPSLDWVVQFTVVGPQKLRIGFLDLPASRKDDRLLAKIVAFNPAVAAITKVREAEIPEQVIDINRPSVWEATIAPHIVMDDAIAALDVAIDEVPASRDVAYLRYFD